MPRAPSKVKKVRGMLERAKCTFAAGKEVGETLGHQR